MNIYGTYASRHNYVKSTSPIYTQYQMLTYHKTNNYHDFLEVLHRTAVPWTNKQICVTQLVRSSHIVTAKAIWTSA